MSNSPHRPHNPPMNALWQQLTLVNLPLANWRGSSYAARLVGALHQWQAGSWLMMRSEALAIWLLAMFFGLAPFVSTTLMSILLGGCAAFWLLLTLADGVLAQDRADAPARIQVGLTPIHLIVMLYWGISVVATALSPVRSAAIEGLGKLTLYLLMFVFMARVFRSAKARAWVLAIYLHVTLLVSTYGIRQWIFGAEPLATWSDPDSAMGNFTRVYSFLGNPNLLAAYLIPAIAYSLMAILIWPGRMRKALAGLMAVMNILCLMFTYSRGGWIGLVLTLVTLAVLMGYWFHLYRRAWVLPAVLGGLVGTILIGVVLIPPVRSRVLSMFIGRGDSSNNFRINVWTSVLDMIRHKPILGIGPGNRAFNQVYPLYARARFTALSAYSIVLEVAVETGIFGVLCFLWLLATTFSQGAVQLARLRKLRDTEAFWLMGAIATLVGLLGHGLFDTVLYRPQVNTLWWLSFAIIASFYVPQEESTIQAEELGELSAVND
jgi:putative inorganic carbon (hco3(-)) transporter